MVVPTFSRPQTSSSATKSPVSLKKRGTSPPKSQDSPSGDSREKAGTSNAEQSDGRPHPLTPLPPCPPALANVWFLRKQAHHLSSAVAPRPHPDSSSDVEGFPENGNGVCGPASGGLDAAPRLARGDSSQPDDEELYFRQRGAENFLRFHPMYECIRALGHSAPGGVDSPTASPSRASKPNFQPFSEKNDSARCGTERSKSGTEKRNCLFWVLDQFLDDSDSYEIWDWEGAVDDTNRSCQRLGAQKIDYRCMVGIVTRLYKELLETSEKNQAKLNQLKKLSHNNDRQQNDAGGGRAIQRLLSDDTDELQDTVAVPEFLAKGAWKKAAFDTVKKNPHMAPKGTQPKLLNSSGVCGTLPNGASKAARGNVETVSKNSMIAPKGVQPKVLDTDIPAKGTQTAVGLGSVNTSLQIAPKGIQPKLPKSAPSTIIPATGAPKPVGLGSVKKCPQIAPKGIQPKLPKSAPSTIIPAKGAPKPVELGSVKKCPQIAPKGIQPKLSKGAPSTIIPAKGAPKPVELGSVKKCPQIAPKGIQPKLSKGAPSTVIPTKEYPKCP
ncbi:hypothetical protein TGRUB_221560 [Toxoplasma gondii RUB]|uniref:Uncharacterized protein n=1 Tax=Toxoplasma gondii RUB TaxID=935652 RepID=A0A086LWS3_TOXGO|nr:hypothetical protein TGRUB_221560 [Toxoplasma gondii RUB]